MINITIKCIILTKLNSILLIIRIVFLNLMLPCFHQESKVGSYKYSISNVRGTPKMYPCCNIMEVQFWRCLFAIILVIWYPFSNLFGKCTVICIQMDDCNTKNTAVAVSNNSPTLVKPLVSAYALDVSNLCHRTHQFSIRKVSSKLGLDSVLYFYWIPSLCRPWKLITQTFRDCFRSISFSCFLSTK